MECGHSAQGKDGTGADVCVICSLLGDPELERKARTPKVVDLEGRRARCSYYGPKPINSRSHESNYGCKRGQPCLCEVPSADNLPFFGHRPERAFDDFYCGCFGWD